jgi:hypothetical protein
MLLPQLTLVGRLNSLPVDRTDWTDRAVIAAAIHLPAKKTATAAMFDLIFGGMPNTEGLWPRRKYHSNIQYLRVLATTVTSKGELTSGFFCHIPVFNRIQHIEPHVRFWQPDNRMWMMVYMMWRFRSGWLKNSRVHLWLPLDQSWTIDSPKQHLHDIHGNLKPVHHMIRPSASKCHHSVKSRASSFTPAPSNPRHVPFCFEDNKHETNQQTDKQDKQTRRPPAHTHTG